MACSSPSAPGGGTDGGAGTVALGALIYDQTPPVDGSAPEDTTAMVNYAAMVGGKPSILMWYERWAGQGPTAFPTDDVDRVVEFGATPMITWEACNPVSNKCQTTSPSVYTDKNIAAGMFDTYLESWAQAAKAWGKPFFLRLNHEMNGIWYPWATGQGNPNGNAAEDYVAAWTHVHQVFDSVGVTNATWVWSPNVGYPPLASDYPGDAWVDWVALDGYNWGGQAWTSFKDVFDASYAELTAFTDKPLMFAETACAPEPGDKPSWIEQGFLGDLPTSFPRTRAVIWFDNVWIDNGYATDFRVNSSSASLDAWTNVVEDPYFQAPPLL